MSEIKVSVIITNYNGRTILEKSLPFFENAYKYKKNNIIETIIVDDASSDDSIEFVRKNYPHFKIVKHKVNRGYSSTVNTGVRSARGNLVAVVNNDVYPSNNFLEKSLVHFEDPLVFGVSFHEKGYGPSVGFYKNGFVEHKPGTETKVASDTFWVSGGSGIFSRKIWMLLGGFDEKLLNPFYWEDIDICYRAQKRGYRLLWEPNSLVEHNHESTIGKLSKNYVAKIRERNYLIFIWKNITSKRLFQRHLLSLIKRVFLHPGYLLIVLMSISRYSQLVKARKNEIKETKISDEAIFQRFLRI